MICHKCNFENDNDARFCEQCGSELINEYQYDITEEGCQTTENAINKRRKLVLFTVIALIVVSVFGIGLYVRSLGFRYDYDYDSYYNELITIRNHGKFGFVRNNRPWYSEVIPPQYDDAGRFSGHVSSVCLDGQWGYINENNDVIINFQYEDALEFSEGLAPVKKDGRWGYINGDNEIVIPFIYDDALSLYDGLMAVKKDGKWGFIDRHGDVVIAFDYNEIISDFGLYGFREFKFNKRDSRGTQISKDGRLGVIWEFCDNSGNVTYKFSEL